MDISILFATYNRPDILRQSLLRYCELDAKDLTWELVIVDNTDHADNQKIVEDFHSRLPIRYLVANKPGKSCALNKGIATLQGSLILLTDDDIQPDRLWLINMWKGAERWPNHMVFGGRIFPKFPTDYIPWDLTHTRVKSAYGIADWGSQEEEYPPIRVWGGNMAFRASVFHDGNRFDENIGPHGEDFIMGEDSEFVARVCRSYGMCPIYLPQAIVYHQILPEQLTLNWLYQRVYRSGRTHAYVSGAPEPSTPQYLGVPRRLLSAFLKSFVLFHFPGITPRNQSKFLHGLNYWHKKGLIYQYWKGVPKHRMVDY